MALDVVLYRLNSYINKIQDQPTVITSIKFRVSPELSFFNRSYGACLRMEGAYPETNVKLKPLTGSMRFSKDKLKH